MVTLLSRSTVGPMVCGGLPGSNHTFTVTQASNRCVILTCHLERDSIVDTAVGIARLTEQLAASEGGGLGIGRYIGVFGCCVWCCLQMNGLFATLAGFEWQPSERDGGRRSTFSNTAEANALSRLHIGFGSITTWRLQQIETYKQWNVWKLSNRNI